MNKLKITLLQLIIIIIIIIIIIYFALKKAEPVGVDSIYMFLGVLFNLRFRTCSPANVRLNDF